MATNGQGAELTAPVSGPTGTARPRHNISLNKPCGVNLVSSKLDALLYKAVLFIDNLITMHNRGLCFHIYKITFMINCNLTIYHV